MSGYIYTGREKNKNEKFRLGGMLNKATLKGRLLSALLVVALLAFVSACSESTTEPVELGSSQKASNGTTLYLKMTDNGALVRNLGQGVTVSVIATVKSPEGEPIEGEVISFSTDVGTLSAENKLTNSSGRAEVSLVSGQTPQAGEIVAVVRVDGEEITVSYGVEVGGVATTTPNTSAIGGSQSNDGAMEFVSADPQQIVLKSTGGVDRTELSTVTFKLVGADSLPLVGKTVNFSINNRVGGISLEPASAVTDGEGLVSTVVQAGTVPASVAVTASATIGESGSATVVTSVSSSLAVGSGLPDQDSMSLSFDNLAPEAWDFDGVEVGVTIRLADHFNNYVADGTTVYFVTEGGVIEPSCETVDSACSVKWISQSPKPLDHRATILATTIGSESFKYADSNGVYNVVDGEPFTDVNGNRVYDAGEPYIDLDGSQTFNGPGFVDLGESFLDANESGIRDAGEYFVDSNANGEYDVAGDGAYNGVLCDPASSACSADKAVQISKSGVLVMAGSFPLLAVENRNLGLVYVSNIPSIVKNTSGPVEADGEITKLTVTYSDSAGQVMPSDTTIAVTSSVGQLVGSAPATVMSRTSGNGMDSFVIRLKDTDTAVTEGGVLQIVFTTPKGVVTTVSLDLSI